MPDTPGLRESLTTDTKEWRYLKVRRLFNVVEESIAKSARWCVFEPNDWRLRGTITRNPTAFLTAIWRDGALVGLGRSRAARAQPQGAAGRGAEPSARVHP